MYGPDNLVHVEQERLKSQTASIAKEAAKARAASTASLAAPARRNHSFAALKGRNRGPGVDRGRGQPRYFLGRGLAPDI